MLAITAADNPIDLQQTIPQKSVSRKSMERPALALICVLYLFCAVGFTLATPYGEAPDEWLHLKYIEYIIANGQLPEIKAGAYTSSAFHPPLYYTVAAVPVLLWRTLTNTSRTAPLAPDVRANPDFAPFTDPRAYLHPPEERWPTTVYVLRGLSMLMGLGVILLTYATARTLVPSPASPVAPLLAASFAALIPEANFIRSTITNENASALVGAAIVWLIVSHLNRPYSPKRVVALGVALGLGILTKLSVAPLALPAFIALWARGSKKPKSALRDMALAAGLILLVAGWFHIYKWVVYGDPLAYGAWQRMLPPDNVFELGDLFWFNDPFRGMLWTSFWGVYGWHLIFMPGWIYNTFLAVTVAAIGGGAYLVARRVLNRGQTIACALLLLVAFLLYALVVLASTYLVAWQGKELNPSLSSICVLLGVGLAVLPLGRAAVQPLEASRARTTLGWTLLGTVTAALFALNAYAIIWLVAPALNAQ